MDRFLRRATLIVLLVLAFLVWFEVELFGSERGAIRFTVGVLCFYVAVQSLERQRLTATFQQVLHAFRDFKGNPAGASQAASGRAAQAAPSAKERREAVEILIAALRRGGATADLALGNLKRVTGRDHGLDPEAWQRWLDAQPHA